jgi:acetyl esterase
MADLQMFSVAIEDVVYLHDGESELLARAYRPRTPDRVPALVYVHGGHWIAGDRLSGASICESLAAAGVLVLSIDFRMPPECMYPGSVADVHYAIRWLKQHAADLGSEGSLVGAASDSSGGHTLLLAAMRPHDPRYAQIPLPEAPESDARLRFAVLFYPIVDPLARYWMAKETGLDYKVEGHDAYFGSVEAMEEGNPQLILDRQEPVELPPILYHHGALDSAVPSQMPDRFATSYRDAGGTIDLEIYDETPHGFMSPRQHCPATTVALERSLEFIEKSCN